MIMGITNFMIIYISIIFFCATEATPISSSLGSFATILFHLLDRSNRSEGCEKGQCVLKWECQDPSAVESPVACSNNSGEAWICCDVENVTVSTISTTPESLMISDNEDGLPNSVFQVVTEQFDSTLRSEERSTTLMPAMEYRLHSDLSTWRRNNWHSNSNKNQVYPNSFQKWPASSSEKPSKDSWKWSSNDAKTGGATGKPTENRDGDWKWSSGTNSRNKMEAGNRESHPTPWQTPTKRPMNHHPLHNKQTVRYDNHSPTISLWVKPTKSPWIWEKNAAERYTVPSVPRNRGSTTLQNEFYSSTRKSVADSSRNPISKSTLYPRWHSHTKAIPSPHVNVPNAKKDWVSDDVSGKTKDGYPIRTTAFKKQSTTKYTSTTVFPPTTTRACGVRDVNAVTNRRGRNGILTSNPDAVVVYPDSAEWGGSERSSFQRIVGGEESEPFSWPWVAALYKVTSNGRNRFLSAGSLINERFILTAAHVFTNEDLRSFTYEAMLGTHTTKEAVANYRVEWVLRHPSYQQRFYYHDIALLRLEKAVRFSSYVMPVCLPSPAAPLSRDSDLVGRSVTVMGWGDESFGGITSRVLKEVSFPIVSRRSCNASYVRVASNRFPNGITSYMLCAGAPNGGKDACQGDSGGPLTILQGDRYTQVGIVSFGYKCGHKDYPGVYTKVAPYLDWISKNSHCDYEDFFEY